MRRGLILGLAATFVLAFLSPVVDHHLAERQIDHSHVYLTQSAASNGHPDHHPFENFHSHDESAADPGQDGVLYQTSDDGRGDPGSISGGAVVANDLPHLLNSGDLLSRAISAASSQYLSNFVPPPEKPPRA